MLVLNESHCVAWIWTIIHSNTCNICQNVSLQTNRDKKYLYLLIFNGWQLYYLVLLPCFSVWDTLFNCMLTFHINNPRAAPSRILNTKFTKKVTWFETCSANLRPGLTKTTNPTVLGLGLRMPIPHCFLGSSQEAAMSMLRCTMRKNKRWRAL